MKVRGLGGAALKVKFLRQDWEWRAQGPVRKPMHGLGKCRMCPSCAYKVKAQVLFDRLFVFLALILLLACKTGADSELGQLDLTKVRVSVGADGCEREGR